MPRLCDQPRDSGAPSRMPHSARDPRSSVQPPSLSHCAWYTRDFQWQINAICGSMCQDPLGLDVVRGGRLSMYYAWSCYMLFVHVCLLVVSLRHVCKGIVAAQPILPENCLSQVYHMNDRSSSLPTIFDGESLAMAKVEGVINTWIHLDVPSLFLLPRWRSGMATQS